MLFYKWEGPQSFHLRLRASANTSRFLSVRLWNHTGSTGRLARDQRQDQAPGHLFLSALGIQLCFLCPLWAGLTASLLCLPCPWLLARALRLMALRQG